MWGRLPMFFRAAMWRSDTTSQSPRAKARTPANTSGRKGGELSAVSAVHSAVAIGRRPAPLLKFRSSAVPQLQFAGVEVHRNAGSFLELEHAATTTPNFP